MKTFCMKTKSVIALISTFLVGVLLGYGVSDTGRLPGKGLFTVPRNAVELTKCVPQMGFHHADPSTLPRGPIYLLDGDNEVLGMEYLFTEAELESEGAGEEFMVSAHHAGFDNVSLTFMPDGVPDMPMPMYALHLYRHDAQMRATVCDGEELEEMHNHMREEMEEHMGEDMMDEMREHMGWDNEDEDVVTSADDAPEGSMHNLPVPDAVAAVREMVATELGVEEGGVIVMSANEKEWSDSCLGLGGPAESCLMAITPGYEVTVLAESEERVYRTNADGSVIRAE